MAAKLAGPRGRRFNLGQNSDMNVTPFVDVMLVLLIVFMVTAPLATTAIRIDNPAGSISPARADPPTYVSIVDSGQIFVATANGMKASSLDALANDLATTLGGPNPTTRQVFIRAGPHVKYGRFMAVMDRLESDGYANVGLISEEVQS
jgi:biopolymer transport protein ExbD